MAKKRETVLVVDGKADLVSDSGLVLDVATGQWELAGVARDRALAKLAREAREAEAEDDQSPNDSRMLRLVSVLIDVFNLAGQSVTEFGSRRITNFELEVYVRFKGSAGTCRKKDREPHDPDEAKEQKKASRQTG